ncbi:MAG: transglycosylase SLT domain-containing protein [Gemmatimonadales bacterium]|nr:transglycosylase SLT domain-containing protein [Gemmatimonadales bacterium]
MGVLTDSALPAAVSPASAATAERDAAALNALAAADPGIGDVPAFDGQGVRWDIDVISYATHPRVQYYLSYFQHSGRHGMAAFLTRGVRYESLIRRRFEDEGLPGDLGYLALIESGYSNEAVSRANAVGMWQFMRATGRGYGLRVDSWVDERRDPIRATDAAARHLRDLRDRFGSLYLAAAAYNAGAGKVSRSLGKLQWEEPVITDTLTEDLHTLGADLDEESLDSTESVDADTLEANVPIAPAAIPNATPVATSDAAFFRLAGTELLATETQDYVPKLIAAAIIAKNPARYGFAPPSGHSLSYDSLVVHDATGLDVIARLAGTSAAQVRELNPQFLRLATPPRARAVIRLPAGTGEMVALKYSALPRSARVRYLLHTVRRRETLSTIASRYHLPASEIRAANPRVDASRPRAGTRLIIPAAGVPSMLAMRAAGAHISGPRPRGPGRTTHATHRVRRGETLTAIARRYRVSVTAIRRANALPPQLALRPGMRLRIPA